MKKKVLVTGGTGYIGSHTVVELQNEGYDVFIIDNLSNSDIKVLDGINDITGSKPVFEQIDLCNFDRLQAFFTLNPDIEAVIHFAALKAVGESVEKPLLYYYNNISSLINLMQCMKDFNIPSMVFSSSCTVYGQPDKLPVSEDSPVKQAESPYGNTKKIGEDIISDTVRACESLRAVSLRYFNPIGAHPSALIGELPLGVPENLVPFITQTAAGIRDELKVFGDDYDTADGSAVRDYIHVVDLAQAHVVALNRLSQKKNKDGYEVFNLGAGRGVSVFEAIESFERVSGEKLNYRVTGRRAGDIEKIWADASLANKELGWSAKLSLDDAMKSAWEWQKNLDRK
ncbi:MAG: UDP-glucose 4-epimerase GalE [Bacteroidales bacterium]|nr:UDP-glucose 4-epimerase GalE [Bacteroidales bacterium]